MKILIAEDDRFIREGLQELIESEGYTPIPAIDGDEALKLYNKEKPDFVLLDIMMPKQDGYALCREIRKVNAEVPIIFISAKSEEIDRVVGLELGADDYILKPFGSREVIARIRAVTRRCLSKGGGDKSAPSTLSFGDLDVLPAELRARRGEACIDLSLRDVKILELLHDNKGKIVDRNTIFDRCWGQNYLPSSRTLDQHISKLRKLIEIDPHEPLIIKTVHGVGYRYDG
jgi:DNA-binding response OmpR family regulator